MKQEEQEERGESQGNKRIEQEGKRDGGIKEKRKNLKKLFKARSTDDGTCLPFSIFNIWSILNGKNLFVGEEEGGEEWMSQWGWLVTIPCNIFSSLPSPSFPFPFLPMVYWSLLTHGQLKK